MKKVLFGLGACLLLAGCGNGNKVVCTGTEEEDGVKVTMEVTATLKNEKVNGVSATMSFSDKKTAEQYCSIFELANSMSEDEQVDVKCDGKKIIFADYTQMSSGDDEIIGLSKEEFIKAMEDTELKCK